jgi:hypothetical protein
MFFHLHLNCQSQTNPVAVHSIMTEKIYKFATLCAVPDVTPYAMSFSPKNPKISLIMDGAGVGPPPYFTGKNMFSARATTFRVKKVRSSYPAIQFIKKDSRLICCRRNMNN